LAWSIGGSKADLLELKVAAWAVVTSGLESEVQCIPQQMHELRPFPVPDYEKVLKELSIELPQCSTLESVDGLGAVDNRKRPDFWGKILTLQ
jgi:hypothetical protein